MDDELEWLYADSSGSGNGSGGSGFNKCGEYQHERYRNLAIIAASMGVVSLVASLLVILVILVLKKYQIFVQRLILYLSTVIALNAVSLILRFGRVAYKNHQNRNLKNLCMAAAFLDQTTRWSMTIAYTCLTFTLLAAVVFNSSGERFEIGYICAIFILPVLFNWIPFINGTYGEAGAWCWIKIKDYEYDEENVVVECPTHTLGTYLTYILWYVPNYILLFTVIVVYIVVVIMLIRNSRRWKGMYSTGIDSKSEKRRMKELVMPIILYPLAFFILNFFPLLNRVYETILDPNYTLWLLHAIFSPLQGGFVAVLYAMDKDTIHRLSMRECLAYLLHRRTKIDEYPAAKGRTDSFEHLLPNEEPNIVIAKYGSLEGTLKTSNREEQDEKV